MTASFSRDEPFNGTDDLLSHIEDHAEDEDSELLQKLVPCLAYFDDHLDEYINGNLHYSDLPHYHQGLQYLIYESVGFGACLAGRSATVFHVYDASTHSFKGVYAIEDHAIDRTEDEPELKAEPLNVANDEEPGYVDEMVKASQDELRSLGENFRYIWENRRDFLEGQVPPSDLPGLDSDTAILMTYAVVYGILWELESPGLYGVFSGDMLEEVHHGKGSAATAANSGNGLYSQQISFADHHSDISEIL